VGNQTTRFTVKGEKGNFFTCAPTDAAIKVVFHLLLGRAGDLLQQAGGRGSTRMEARTPSS